MFFKMLELSYLYFKNYPEHENVYLIEVHILRSNTLIHTLLLHFCKQLILASDVSGNDNLKNFFNVKLRHITCDYDAHSFLQMFGDLKSTLLGIVSTNRCVEMKFKVY